MTLQPLLLKYIQRRSLRYWWNWAWFLWVVLLLYPIGYGVFRLFLVIVSLFLWLGIGILFWNHKIVKFTFIIISFTISLIAILPGHPVNSTTLREHYVQGLEFFMGTKYVWGGKSKLGIDCSGLVKEGMVIADLKYGLISLNPQLIREGLSIWWYTASAETLGAGYRNKTQVIMNIPSINQLDHTKIAKGDFAVTRDGVHTLAYTGNNIWIEADPTYRKVIEVKVPDLNIIWFKVPVSIVQWKQLQ